MGQQQVIKFKEVKRGMFLWHILDDEYTAYFYVQEKSTEGVTGLWVIYNTSDRIFVYIPNRFFSKRTFSIKLDKWSILWRMKLQERKHLFRIIFDAKEFHKE